MKVQGRGLLFQQVEQLSELYKAADRLTERVSEVQKGKPLVKGVTAAGPQAVADALGTAMTARRSAAQVVGGSRVETKRGYHFEYDHHAKMPPTEKDQELARLRQELLLRKIEREQAERGGPDGGEVDAPDPAEVAAAAEQLERTQRLANSQVEEKAKLDDELQLLELQRELQLQQQQEQMEQSFSSSSSDPYGGTGAGGYDPDRGYE